MQPGDRVKRWSILLPTMALPRSLRVTAREHWLSKLQIAKAQRAELLIIGHPKSGNTWLRSMLSRLFQIRFGLPASIIVKSDEAHRHNPAAPRILATNGYYSYESVVGRALARDAREPSLRNKKVVLLVRNPCDIAVSWYFQFTKRQSAYKNELINHFIEHPIDRRNVEMWEFVRHSDLGLSSLIDFLNNWEHNLAGMENSLLLSYEELRADPRGPLRRISDLVGWNFTDAEIDAAAEYGSFENLRKLESQGFFSTGGMNLRNASDPETFKVRRGKVNGYRDYFTPEQVAELEELMTSKLSPSLGYRPPSAAAS